MVRMVSLHRRGLATDVGFELAESVDQLVHLDKLRAHFQDRYGGAWRTRFTPGYIKVGVVDPTDADVRFLLGQQLQVPIELIAVKYSFSQLLSYHQAVSETLKASADLSPFQMMSLSIRPDLNRVVFEVYPLAKGRSLLEGLKIPHDAIEVKKSRRIFIGGSG